jgi:hypothetical protein
LKTKEDQGEKQKGLHKPKRIKERTRKVFTNQRELRRETERSSQTKEN